MTNQTSHIFFVWSKYEEMTKKVYDNIMHSQKV